MKRAFDVVASVILLLLALPVLVVCAAGSVIALRSSPLFLQTRIGRDGRPFRFVKLRTLPASTPPYADKYELDLAGVPRFSAWLRRLHLDELPQLLLVPLGHMSLVGPRPEMPDLHDHLESDFARERTAVRPGCTGLWQIGDKNHLLIGESPEFDRIYLRHRTFRLDLWILLRSARSVLPGARRVSLAEIPAWTGARSRRLDDHRVIDLTAPEPVTAVADA